LRLWIAAAVLLAIVAVGLAMAPRAIDWNAHRADFEASASELTGHQVTIGGPINVSFLPRPLVTAKDVVMRGKTDTSGGFNLIVGHVEASLELGPWLAGQPVLRDLNLRRPVLSLDDEAEADLLSWPPSMENWLAPFLKLDLERVGIANGKIEIKGAPSAASVALNDISLEVLTNKPNGPLEAAGLFKTQRQSFTIKATLGQSDANGLRAARLTIEAQNGVDEITSARFSGSLTVSGDDPGLQGQVSLEGPDLKRGLSALASATGYSSTFRSLAEQQAFSIRGRIEADRASLRSNTLQLTLSEKRGEGSFDVQFHPQHQLNLDLDLPTLHLADEAILADFLPLDVLSKLEVPPGSIDLDIREIRHRDQAIRQASLALRTGADRAATIERAKAQLPGLIDMAFEGRVFPGNIGPKLSGKLTAVGDDLGNSLAWQGLIDAEKRGNGWRRFSLESTVDITNVEIALSSIDMRLDSSKLEGRANLRFGERLALSLDTDIDRLNMDLYSALWKSDDGAERLMKQFSDLDASIATRFKRLIWRDIHVEEATISADASDGEIKLERLAAKTVGGTAFDIEGEISLREEAARLNGRLESLHPIRALRHLGIALPPNRARIQPIDVSGSLNGALDRFDLRVEADYDGGSGVIEGEAGLVEDEARYDLTIEARHPDHLALAGHFGLAPILPLGDADGEFELTGKLKSDETTPLLASGSAKLGPSTFTGSLAYLPDAPVGPWELKLSIGTPKWDSLTPFLAMAGVRAATDWTPGRWLGRIPKVGLGTAWIDDIEGSVSLASKGGLVGDGLELSARLVDGLLYVNRLEASPWGGGLTAELTFERRREQPFAAIAIDLNQVQAADLTRWLGIKDGIEGPLDLQFEADMSGLTPYGMMSGLFGQLEVMIGPGELNGLGIPSLRRLLVPRDEDAPLNRSLSQPFEEINIKADINRGVANLQDARLLISQDLDEPVETAITGALDLLLWIVELTLAPEIASTTSETETAPEDEVARSVYRVVGAPDRPAGLIVGGN